MSSPERSGLYAGSDPVPLTGVTIDARVIDGSIETTMRQQFVNDRAEAIEAVYVFPLPEHAALCGFSLQTAQGRAIGDVIESEEAYARYENAREDGHAAGLVEQLRPNVFSISVGNVGAGEQLIVELRWVALTRWRAGSLRVTIPTTVSPRYTPTRKNPTIKELSESARINQEAWLVVPYGFSFSLEADLLGGMQTIESKTHPIRCEWQEQHRARIELATAVAAMDQDLVIDITAREQRQPVTRWAKGPDERVYAMVTLFPDLAEQLAPQPIDVTFIIDCSGSMSGSSIEQARSAIGLCLRTLGDEDRFRIICFGDEFTASTWQDATPHAIEQALKDAAAIRADLGGTVLLKPLKAALAGKHEDRPLKIMLLSDGQVTNEDRLLKLIDKADSETSVFCVGIGYGPNDYLMQELADRTGGAAESIVPGERIEPRMLQLFGKMRQEHDGMHVTPGTQAPKSAAGFAGDGHCTLIRLPREAPRAIEVTIAHTALTMPLPSNEYEQDSSVPILWAIARIRDLERKTKKTNKKKIIALAKEFNLASRYTSWVAIQERHPEERVVATITSFVPKALTKDWGGLLDKDSTDSARRASRRLLRRCFPQPFASDHRHSLSFGYHSGSDYGCNTGMDDMPEILMRQLDGPMSYSATEEKATPDALCDLLATQQPDGHFSSTDALDRLLEELDTSYEDDARSCGLEIASTRAVLEILETRFSHRRCEWHCCAVKARRWLEQELKEQGLMNSSIKNRGVSDAPDEKR